MVTHIPVVVNDVRRQQRGRCTTALHVAARVDCAADVDAGVRPVPRAAHAAACGKMIYLFLQSVVPTVPGRLADVRRRRRLQGLRPAGAGCGGSASPTDQQLAGAIMKIGGSVFLWAIIIFLFFKRFAVRTRTSTTTAAAARCPTAEIVGNDEDAADDRRRRARVRHHRLPRNPPRR